MSKTITMSDETFETISKFCEAIATQDNRSTRIPYVYAIRDTKRIYGFDPEYGGDDFVWMDEQGETILETDEAFMEYIDECDLDIESEFPVDIDKLDEDETVHGFKRTYYVITNVVRNIFLTEDAALTHLKSYRYQYDDPSIKVIHLSGNNEIMGLINTLNEIIH